MLSCQVTHVLYILTIRLPKATKSLLPIYLEDLLFSTRQKWLDPTNSLTKRRHSHVLLENNTKTESILKNLHKNDYKISNTLLLCQMTCVCLSNWTLVCISTGNSHTQCVTFRHYWFPFAHTDIHAYTHTWIITRLSSLFKCSEKQFIARIKGALSNTVLSCKNGVRIPESQRHYCPPPLLDYLFFQRKPLVFISSLWWNL